MDKPEKLSSNAYFAMQADIARKESATEKKRGMNVVLTNFRKVFGADVTLSVLEGCTGEQFAMKLKITQSTDHMRGARIPILIIMYS